MGSTQLNSTHIHFGMTAAAAATIFHYTSFSIIFRLFVFSLRWMRKKCFIMKSIVQQTHFNLRSETKGQNDLQQQQRMCLWLCLSNRNRTICKKRLINICHGKWIDVCSTHTCAHQKAPDNFNFWAFSSHDFPFLLLLLSPQPSLSMFDCCCSRPITPSARLASIYLSVHDDDATLCKKKLCYESLIGIKYNHSYGEFYLQFHFYWALYWAVGTADTANMALINSIFTSF